MQQNPRLYAYPCKVLLLYTYYPIQKNKWGNFSFPNFNFILTVENPDSGDIKLR